MCLTLTMNRYFFFVHFYIELIYLRVSEFDAVKMFMFSIWLVRQPISIRHYDLRVGFFLCSILFKVGIIWKWK